MIIDVHLEITVTNENSILQQLNPHLHRLEIKAIFLFGSRRLVLSYLTTELFSERKYRSLLDEIKIEK